MRIRHRLVLVAPLALAASLSACGGGSSCPEGAYKDAETNVCFKLPAGFEVDKATKSGDSSSIRVKNTQSFKSFTIWLDKPEDLDKQAKIVENMASGDLKLVEKGDTSPGKGKFFHFHNTAKDYEFAVALVPGKQHMYRCEIQNTPAADAKPMLEACKTVSGP